MKKSEWYCRTVHCFQKIWLRKGRTQTSTEMGISCQRNGHWAATNYLSGRGLVQPIKELSSAAGRCAGRGCALIRQLANTRTELIHYVANTCALCGQYKDIGSRWNSTPRRRISGGRVPAGDTTFSVVKCVHASSTQ